MILENLGYSTGHRTLESTGAIFFSLFIAVASVQRLGRISKTRLLSQIMRMLTKNSAK